MVSCNGSQAAGAKTMTATSIMGTCIGCGNALCCIFCKDFCNFEHVSQPELLQDLSISMQIIVILLGARDSGWIQLYSETNQEAYDNMLQAKRIGEHPDVSASYNGMSRWIHNKPCCLKI